MNLTRQRRFALLTSCGIALGLLAARIAPAASLTVGDTVQDRPVNDTVSGSIFVVPDLTFSGVATNWSWFDNDFNGGRVTPLIVRQTGAGTYQIAGIGTTRMSTATGIQNFPFGLMGGSAALGPGLFFAFKDGSNGSDNTGVIDWTDGTPDLIRWLGAGHTALAVNDAKSVAFDLARSYSVQFTESVDGALVGDAAVKRALNDTASGSIFVLPEGPGGNRRLVEWGFHDHDNPGLNVTPLLMELVAGNYVVRGVGTARASSGLAGQSFAFAVVEGSDVASNANFRFAWKDGTDGANNTGVIDYNDNAADSVIWLGDLKTAFDPGASYPPVVTRGRTYSVQALFVEAFVPPGLRLAPTNQTVLPGATVRLVAAASGTPPPGFQWRKDGLPLAGETNATLVFSNVSPVRAGSYDVVVSSPYGSTTSAPPAVLTILTPPSVATGGLVITEFLASNNDVLFDEDGDAPDWIEIQNTNPFAVNLAGWHLTDTPTNLALWTFPTAVLGPGEFIVVFASAKDRRVPGAPLHVNFKLEAGGEYLALVEPDGAAIAQEFAPAVQHGDTSFGLSHALTTNRFVAGMAGVKFLVPSSGALALTWTGGNEPFDDAAWTAGQTGVGFDTNGTPVGPPAEIAGPPLISRPIYDTATGSIFVMESSGFTQAGTVTEWGLFSTTTLSITPLLMRRDPGGNYLITGIGTKRASSGAGEQHFPFGLVAGSAAVGPGFFLAWKDGGPGANNTGVPAWDDNTGASVRWFGAQTTFGVGGNLGFGQSFARSYSLQATVVAALAAYVKANVQSLMLGVNASLYLRAPFTLASVPALDLLTLRMRYEDGFVAWLNGVEIARRNAPAVLEHNATAVTNRSEGAAVVVEDIDVTAFAGALRPGANVLGLQGMNDSASSPNFLVLPELTGLRAGTFTNRYMSTPTPGATNGTGVIGFVADTKFSTNRGFFTAPFSLSITTATAGAEIWFTTDGSVPGPSNTNATPYTNSLVIARTTTLRAAAFKADFAPTDVDTHTYIFAGQVVSQPPNPPGLPASWAGLAADYGMDANVAAAALPGYSVTDALLALPTVSVTASRDDLFGPGAGIYNNSSARGEAWERVASIEFFSPTNPGAFQANAGIRLSGDSSRGHGFTPKHSLTISFRDRLGPSKLRFPLFADTGVQEFDKLELRACSTDSWPVVDGYDVNGIRRWTPGRATYFRDQWMRDAMDDLGRPNAHGRYVHLYLNGLYWGVYNLVERMNDAWNAAHLGGGRDEFDVLKDYAELEAGTRDAWDEMMTFAAGGLATEAAYQRLQGNSPDGTRNPGFPVHLHVAEFIDYMLLHIYCGAEDWPGHNWWASRRRGPNSEGFRFYVWDQEISNDSLVRSNCLFGPLFEEVNTAQSPAFLYDKLRQNSSFRQRFSDRVWETMFGNGPLTPAQNAARWAARQSELDHAIVAESARWGDVRRAPAFKRETEWLPEMNWVQNAYWASNHVIATRRFRRVGLFPRLGAPVFSQGGGFISNNFTLAMSHTNAAGAIRFTFDGADPRAVSSTPAESAQTYAAPVPLAALTHVRARVFDGTNWSAPADFTFYPGQVFADLVATEIHYHPPGAPGVDGDEFEFLELQNRGTNTLDLSGVTFTSGINFTFTNGTLLAPGAYFVLVRNAVQFAARYAGAPWHGLYTGKLDNSGETLTLFHPAGLTIFSIPYDDLPPWPAGADGAGPSLQRANALPGANNPTNWTAAPPTPGGPILPEYLDSDGDGLPDEWEFQNGTDPQVNDADGDPDHDGQSNLAEYLAGTDPQSAASVVRISSIQFDAAAGQARLTFNAASNRTYAVEGRISLGTGAWTRLLAIPSAPAARELTVTNSAGGDATRFFRLTVP